MADKVAHGGQTSRSLRAELGARLARHRLARNVTQQALAESAGIGLRTLRRVEAGEPSSLDSVLRVTLALGLADGLMSGIPEQEVRPIERVDSRGRQRRRASAPRTSVPEEPWSWSEELDG